MRLGVCTFITIIVVITASSWINDAPNSIENQTTTPLAFVVPKGWPKPVYDFSKNPITQEGFELGRRLFYDGRLSKDGNFSCASCHQQFAAFSTYDHVFSHGINNGQTNRNAPGLFNLAWMKDFMADGSIHSLDSQPISPITNKNEMGESIDSVLFKLKKDSLYPKMFAKAFGKKIVKNKSQTCITKENTLKALSQFMLLLVSSNSKYDKVMRGEEKFILPEQLGYDIFKTKCISCHTEPMFTDYTYRNIGMPLNKYVVDFGRMQVTGLKEDSLKFKVPSLRNIALTAPYGHDGRFFDLLNVFEHYRNKMIVSTNTDVIFKNKLPLSNFEIGQLTAFLYTLTDTSFIKDKRFVDPNNVANNPSFIHAH